MQSTAALWVATSSHPMPLPSNTEALRTEPHMKTVDLDLQHTPLLPPAQLSELGRHRPPQVRAVFSSSKRNVAGCMVTEGVLRKAATIVVRRGKRIVFDGPISSLRRVKEIVNEARSPLSAVIHCVRCSYSMAGCPMVACTWMGGP